MSSKGNSNEFSFGDMDESDSSISGHGEDAINVQSHARNDDSEGSDVRDGHDTDSLQGASNTPTTSVFRNGDDDDETSSESDDELLGEKQKSVARLPGKVLLPRKKVVMVSKTNGGLVASKTSSEEVANGSTHVPKTRIKLSLKLPMTKNLQPKRSPTFVNKMKLPISKNLENKEMGSARDDSSGVEEEINELQATVVDSDEAGEVDVIATAVKEESPDSINPNATMTNFKNNADSRSLKKGHESSVKKSGILVSSSKSGYSSAKRRSFHPSRQIRLPPIPSPGLLIPPPTSSQGGQKNVNSIKTNGSGCCTPCELFDSFMELAGYTLEKRSHRPHRGSSVQRAVGDMFDSNVALSLHFSELVPSVFLDNGEAKHVPQLEIGICAQTSDAETPVNTRNNEVNRDSPVTTGQQLIRCMEKVLKNDIPGTTNDIANHGLSRRTSGKRKRPYSFTDMVPVSLTLPFPEDYIQRQIEYARAVKRREEAIVKWQEEQVNIEIAAEEGESSETGTELADSQYWSSKNIVSVPTIPLPPEPPRIEDLLDLEYAGNYKNGQHPIYLPNGKSTLVGHLDGSCFHITDGRYFGLSSNFIADPNFVGANAPGIAALSASAGTGLATSTLGSGSGSGGMTFTLSSSIPSGAGASHTSKSEPLTRDAEPVTSNGKTVSTKTIRLTSSKPALTPSSDSKSLSSKKAVLTSPLRRKSSSKPTASSSNLRKLMEDGGPMTESFRKCIIRAAVHASRTGKHGPSFRGPDGETYPDVSKAFSSHAGIKPCQRCKSNKQGVSFRAWELYSFSCISNHCPIHFRCITVVCGEDMTIQIMMGEAVHRN